jgi:endonuclease-3
MLKKELLQKIKKIAAALEITFPHPHRPSRTSAEQMVFTILSQNTTDKNAEKCLENLKKTTGNNLLKIPELSEKELLAAIRPCGMFRQKLRALTSVMKDWPVLEEKLKKLPTSEGISLLTSYPFIGSKTARVVLTFAFGKNTFPIDTHCLRVLKRLGIFPENWSKDRISEFMEKHFTATFNRRLHYDLIRLGRSICRAQKPECERCPLKEMCETYITTNI